MFAPVLDARFMHELDGSLRRQSYDQTTTFWAWVGQVLGGNASCSQAVGQVQAWCAEARKPVPASKITVWTKVPNKSAPDLMARGAGCVNLPGRAQRQREARRMPDAVAAIRRTASFRVTSSSVSSSAVSTVAASRYCTGRR